MPPKENNCANESCSDYDCRKKYIIVSGRALHVEQRVNRLLSEGYNFHGFTQKCNCGFFQVMFLPDTNTTC